MARSVKKRRPMSHLSSELAFLRAIALRSPILPREQELELTRRFRDAQDSRAADTLVRAHLRMVIALAVKHRHYGIPVVELVAEGNLGLVTALRKFDPEHGVRFGTYARHWVRAEILCCVVRSLSVLDGSAGIVKRRLFFKLRRERARIAAILGDGDTADEALALCLNVSVEEAHQLSSCLGRRNVSMDALGQDSRDRLADTLISRDDPERRYIDCRWSGAAASAIALAVKSLDARERFIAEHRILASANDELSLTQIGKTWGISRERVRQLEERAKQKLGRCAAIKGNSSLNEWLGD
jgi:RNA polymerase sigma-32 factor